MRSKKLNPNKIEISNLDSAKINEGTNNILGGATVADTCLTSYPDTKINTNCQSLKNPCLLTQTCFFPLFTEQQNCNIAYTEQKTCTTIAKPIK